MPELPEVETTCRGITPHVKGARITHVTIRESRLRWPIPPDLPSFISGQRVIGISRRGKYLLLQFKSGHLIIHLGMSGSLRITDATEPSLKHDHVVFKIGKREMRFNDPRRFGCVLWTKDKPLEHALLAHLGPEPLSEAFTGDYLYRLSRKRKVAIKNFVMDSKVVVGVGNIYANEALFLSGVRPRTAASRLTKAACESIVSNIKAVLTNAISMGGTTLRDFVGGDGKPGYFQQTLHVYDRKNQPCTQCATPIKHIVIGQRSTYYCPNCQQ